jgi:hypothetical protein
MAGRPTSPATKERIKARARQRTALARARHIVFPIDRAARELGVDPNALAAMVHTARLQPWAIDGRGVPVFRWPSLVELARIISSEHAFEEA